MRIKLILANPTHQTQVVIRPDLEPACGRLWSTHATIRRAERRLCPTGCCGPHLALACFYNGPGNRLGFNQDQVWAHRAEVERVLRQKVEA